MALSKAEKAKLYDAGQAAQLNRVPDEACPFPEGSEEYDAYMEGKEAELDEKWTTGARAISQEIVN
jgi:hypothetical protein